MFILKSYGSTDICSTDVVIQSVYFTTTSTHYNHTELLEKEEPLFYQK